jgi:hypothetical protein
MAAKKSRRDPAPLPVTGPNKSAIEPMSLREPVRVQVDDFMELRNSNVVETSSALGDVRNRREDDVLVVADLDVVL